MVTVFYCHVMIAFTFYVKPSTLYGGMICDYDLCVLPCHYCRLSLHMSARAHM